MRRQSCFGLLLVLGLGTGCSSGMGDGGLATHDSGVVTDGGHTAVPDAQVDAGGVEASQPGVDAGPMVDASMPAEASMPVDGGPYAAVTCATPPPPGAPTPPPPPTYGGTCPTLMPGHNDITSSGNTRTFLLIVPDDYDPSQSYPLFFLWHWLKGSSDGFADKGDVQNAANLMHFIAVIPDAKGDLLYTWPYIILDSASRINEELQFFDDMFACVSAQYSINRECVTTSGVSAGALWTDQAHRATRPVLLVVHVDVGWHKQQRRASFHGPVPPAAGARPLGRADRHVRREHGGCLHGPRDPHDCGRRLPRRVRPQLRPLGAAHHGARHDDPAPVGVHAGSSLLAAGGRLALQRHGLAAVHAVLVRHRAGQRDHPHRRLRPERVLSA